MNDAELIKHNIISVRKRILEFINENGIDEAIAVSAMFSIVRGAMLATGNEEMAKQLDKITLERAIALGYEEEAGL